MLAETDINNILFLDIETVPLTYRYADLADNLKPLWNAKWQHQKEVNPEELYKKAGIYAEFAKVICITVGYFYGSNFRLKSFYGHDESELLRDFRELLQKHFSGKAHLLCAHNGKEFDFPFLCRRLLINGIRLPKILNIAGKKPWEVAHLDTMELWKFGDYKSYTSLNLLAAVFNIPTPKDEISGSDVSRVYYEEQDLEKIKRYCCKDVVTVARIFQRYLGRPAVPDEQVEITDVD